MPVTSVIKATCTFTCDYCGESKEIVGKSVDNNFREVREKYDWIVSPYRANCNSKSCKKIAERSKHYNRVSKWTKEEEQLVRDAWPEVAVIEGRTEGAVLNRAYLMGLKKQTRPTKHRGSENFRIDHDNDKKIAPRRKKLGKKQADEMGRVYSKLYD